MNEKMLSQSVSKNASDVQKSSGEMSGDVVLQRADQCGRVERAIH